jgi:para-aminobenzoate synthetase component 1
MPSSKQLITALPYFADSAALFSAIAHQSWAVFLDSGYPHSQQGRYDMIAAEPVCTLVTHGDITEINQQGKITHSTANPFDLVKQQLLLINNNKTIELPFNARRLENLPVWAKDAEHIAENGSGHFIVP